MSEKVGIWLKRHSAGRTTAWVVECEKCGEVARLESKTGASKIAVVHAEETHERYVRIHVPV